MEFQVDWTILFVLYRADVNERPLMKGFYSSVANRNSLCTFWKRLRWLFARYHASRTHHRPHGHDNTQMKLQFLPQICVSARPPSPLFKPSVYGRVCVFTAHLHTPLLLAHPGSASVVHTSNFILCLLKNGGVEMLSFIYKPEGKTKGAQEHITKLCLYSYLINCICKSCQALVSVSFYTVWLALITSVM